MSQEIAQPPTHNDFFEELFRRTNKSEKVFFAPSECVVIIIIYLFPILYFFLKRPIVHRLVHLCWFVLLAHVKHLRYIWLKKNNAWHK